MPLKALLLVTVLASCVAGFGYALSKDNAARFLWQGNSSAHGQVASISVPANTSNNPQQTGPNSPQPPSDNPLGYMLASVADQYSQSIRYPSWSVPLTPAQAEGYQGNQFTPVDLPLGSEGYFTVTLEKYRFTQGEPILIAVSLRGPQVFGDSLEATLEQPESRDAVANATLKGSDSAGYYQGSLETNEEPGEYRLIVEAQVDGKSVRHASPLTIEPYLGDFGGLGDPYVSNNTLVIPVHFSPEHSGFYSLSAQLYESARPIAQLRAERQLDMGSGTFMLKVHGTVLAKKQIQGKLQLRHLQLRQLPSKPGDRTNYGFGPEDGYSFSPPDLDGLHDTPAADPESEQRAALLKQLAEKF